MIERDGLARLEQARDHGQRNESSHEAGDRPPAGTRLPGHRVRDRDRSDGNDRIDEVEDFARTPAAGQQPQAAGHSHDEGDEEDLPEPFG
jgi:hypothetical protein